MSEEKCEGCGGTWETGHAPFGACKYGSFPFTRPGEGDDGDGVPRRCRCEACKNVWDMCESDTPAPQAEAKVDESDLYKLARHHYRCGIYTGDGCNCDPPEPKPPDHAGEVENEK